MSCVVQHPHLLPPQHEEWNEAGPRIPRALQPRSSRAAARRRRRRRRSGARGAPLLRGPGHPGSSLRRAFDLRLETQAGLGCRACLLKQEEAGRKHAPVVGAEGGSTPQLSRQRESERASERGREGEGEGDGGKKVIPSSPPPLPSPSPASQSSSPPPLPLGREGRRRDGKETRGG